MSLKPYSFEPKKKASKAKEIDKEGWEDVSSDEESALPEVDHQLSELTRSLAGTEIAADDWCKCGSCVTMSVNRECLCCVEIDEIKSKRLSNDVKCVTEHEGFLPVVLNKYNLWTALVSLNDRECAWLPPDENNVPNRSYHYAAYRQFSWFTYTKLGRYVRRVIPACVVSKIREAFPEPNGVYVNFSGDDDGADAISEVDSAWEYLQQ